MTRFATCLPLILQHEGGFVDDSRDRGGATNLGVTQGTLSDWLGHPASVEDVRALTGEKVAPIYHGRYWTAAACDDLPPGVDYVTFDAAVNSGPRRAIRFLQEAAGVTADGVIGPKTLAAVAAHPPSVVIRNIAAIREAFYLAQPEFDHFGKGWLARLADVTAQALKMT